MSCNPKSRECFVGSHRKCNGEVPRLSTPPTLCQCECHVRDRELVADRDGERPDKHGVREERV